MFFIRLTFLMHFLRQRSKAGQVFSTSLFSSDEVPMITTIINNSSINSNSINGRSSITQKGTHDHCREKSFENVLHSSLYFMALGLHFKGGNNNFYSNLLQLTRKKYVISLCSIILWPFPFSFVLGFNVKAMIRSF